ncbi:hypothetical protein ACFX13_019707 [Malus domestica]
MMALQVADELPALVTGLDYMLELKEHDDCAKFYFQRMMALQVAQELQAQVTRLDYMLELVNQEDFWRDLSSAVIMGGDLNIVRRRRKLRLKFANLCHKVFSEFSHCGTWSGIWRLHIAWLERMALLLRS